MYSRGTEGASQNKRRVFKMNKEMAKEKLEMMLEMMMEELGGTDRKFTLKE